MNKSGKFCMLKQFALFGFQDVAKCLIEKFRIFKPCKASSNIECGQPFPFMKRPPNATQNRSQLGC